MAYRQRVWVFRVVCVLLVTITCLSLSQAATTTPSLRDVITQRDRDRMKQLLVTAETYSDIQEAYYVASGLSNLGFSDSNRLRQENACKYAMSSVDQSDLESVFYAASIAKLLGAACKLSLSDAKDTLAQALEGEPTVANIYHAVTAMDYLGMKIDNATVLPALLTAVENEESVLSSGQAFLAASLIPDVDLSELFDQIEDIVAQADETPTTLYFEGGLKVTSTVVRGIFALAARVKNTPAISGAQATKFGSYLVSSKYTSSVADVHYLVSATNALATNQFVVPSALLLEEDRPISSSNKNLEVRLTHIMGEGVGPFTVILNTIEHPDKEDMTKNKKFTAAKDGVTYSYPLFDDVSGAGVHHVIISTTASEKSPVVELTNVKLLVTVSYQATISTAELSLVDKDQGVTTKTISLDYPNRSKETLEADQHSKVVMTFTLINKVTSDPITVHQAFVRLTLVEQEIFYVAQADKDDKYKFELDVSSAASDFAQQSGEYVLTLIVGDFALENPFSWEVGSVHLKFTGTPPEKTADYSNKPKPEIQHLFRIPDKRPSKAVSSTFTILVLAPLWLLLLLWFLLGANISNFATGGIWGVLFHLGLAGIFSLYYCFWIKLNMFQTLKYLAVIGLVTFAAGNRMLRKIANAKQP